VLHSSQLPEFPSADPSPFCHIVEGPSYCCRSFNENRDLFFLVYRSPLRSFAATMFSLGLASSVLPFCGIRRKAFFSVRTTPFYPRYFFSFCWARCFGDLFLQSFPFPFFERDGESAFFCSSLRLFSFFTGHASLCSSSLKYFFFFSAFSSARLFPLFFNMPPRKVSFPSNWERAFFGRDSPRSSPHFFSFSLA